MFNTQTPLLTLTISNQPNHNITHTNKKTIFPYFKPFIIITTIQLYVSLTNTIITFAISKQSNHNITQKITTQYLLLSKYSLSQL
jgi:hypothetical protein